MGNINTEYKIIKKSGLFDARYYVTTYPDVRQADIDPLWHFVKFGWKDGRNPSAEFNTSEYRLATPELSDNSINPLVHWIISSGDTSQTKPGSSFLVQTGKKLAFLYKGLKFLFSTNGVVFFAGFPYPEREKDGYYQRIRAIDTELTDIWRIYIDNVNLAGRDEWYDWPQPKTLVIRPYSPKKSKLARLCTILIIMRCRKVYFHSVLATGGIERMPLFWKTKAIKKIIDFHGVVPEEFSFQGDKFNAAYYGDVERLFVENAAAQIVVTDAMREHLHSKYPELSTGKVITLPIFQSRQSFTRKTSVIPGRPVIVYAGGTQKWQQIPKMISAIERTMSDFEYRIFCPNPDDIIPFMSEKCRRSPNIILGSLTVSELFEEYRKCHFGFILREDVIVNRVACPTKLIEYLAMGIIPIVDTTQIGDFFALGMQTVSLTDLIQKKLPDEDKQLEMVEKNYIVYDQLVQVQAEGISTLKEILFH